jgi:hypothetical protein
LCFSQYIIIFLGTGLLGLSLSRLQYDVTVSEYNEPISVVCQSPSSVYTILSDNITRHNEKLSDDDDENKVQIFPLNWSESARDIHNWTHDKVNNKNAGGMCTEYDLVLGTDVFFDPTLVLPLLNTASLLTKTGTGTCLFCMQIRCKDSHQLFLEQVTNYFDSYRDISEEVYDITGCAWGRYVECLVFEMKGGKRSSCSSSSDVSATNTCHKRLSGEDVESGKKKKK